MISRRNIRAMSLSRLLAVALPLASQAGARPAYAGMAWIERIENNGGMRLRLSQNDPSRHPVRKSDGRRFDRDEPIDVAPGSGADFSYFVIPWQDYGRLRIEGPGGAVSAVVGPKTGTQTDYLKFRCGSTALQDIGPGPRGSQFVCSARLDLVIDDSRARFVNLGPGPEVFFGPGLELLSRALYEILDGKSKNISCK